MSRAWAALASLALAAPVDVVYFDMDATVREESLDYSEQLLAYVFEGLVNSQDAPHPVVMFNAAYMNFDWPRSDEYWNKWLTEQDRVRFINVSSPSLCSLVQEADPQQRIKGTVRYEAKGQQEEWSMPIAATVAAQRQLLPVTSEILARHDCLRDLDLGFDLTKVPELAEHDKAWEWAFEHLLPNASKRVAFNLYHYEPQTHSDPQSNATLANIDWAVQQKAFIMNFKTTGNPATTVNPLWSRALADMEPLFSTYGWSDDEFGLVWMSESSGAGADGKRNHTKAGGGGAVFCSFATPNLSFWKLLALPDGVTQARRLPVFDRGMQLDNSKAYVQIETNEGDTPRIVVSAFSQAWTDDRRGSVPISWSIDPQLGEEFPALFDYFASTAGANDSFISGPGGCGYVYFGNMTDAQLKTFATRCGRLMKDYGPAVVDSFGQQGLDSVHVLANFSKYAAEGGMAPEMYLSQTTDNIGYAYYPCDQDALNTWQPDGTPVLCTHHDLFYVMGNLGGQELAKRINAIVRSAPKPYFITVYGGLKWTAASGDPKDSIYNFWGDAIANLDDNVVAVGAQEMARLAKAAGVSPTSTVTVV